jgi:hypothetical protein
LGKDDTLCPVSSPLKASEGREFFLRRRLSLTNEKNPFKKTGIRI